MKTDDENMLPRWIMGCFCPAFQQLGYETDHSLPYTAQIRNVVPYTSYTLTHYFPVPSNFTITNFFPPERFVLKYHQPTVSL